LNPCDKMDDNQTFHNQTNIKKSTQAPTEPDRITQPTPKPTYDLIISNTIADLSPSIPISINIRSVDPRFAIAPSHSWPISSQTLPNSFPIGTVTIPYLPSIPDVYKRPAIESISMFNDTALQGLSKRMKMDTDEVIDLSEMDNFSTGNNNIIPSNDNDSTEHKQIKFFDLTTEGLATPKHIIPLPKPATQVKHKHNDADKEEWFETFKLVKDQVVTFRNKDSKSKSSPGEFKKAEFPRFLHDDKIRSWLNHQCKLQKQGALSKEQHDMLVDIGFDFMQRRALRKNQWDEQYEKLKQLKEQHGSCEVPPHFGDKGLKVWVNDQRKNYRNGALRKNKVDMLNALGFSWEAPSRIAKSSSHEMDSEASAPPNPPDHQPAT